ncbi:hypothetical protein ACFSKM_01505 [Ancylobacter dichloromethanicus]
MAMKETVLPDTMTAPETGEILTRSVRPFVVAYKGVSLMVEPARLLSGRRGRRHPCRQGHGGG